ncbi:Cytochrome P450 4F3 [Monoraphidium neglectum]|uniref:Cytochrome P450 4F3 n=1 Tax=Monoraphidium neglectum TaxID=145388 RepID=A0A0D2JDE2_9CHLO|nr:Cytochrome P450 4F3 [Monoraphidium neglectum]KIY97592.1 Cytochrome P450 4F3 [Monoraphidium neglectum]|eukprot:XP_013896612.1 Cytochrome P450 4F3 [Monoraphidium neglectum]
MTSLKRTFPWLLHLCQLAVAELAAKGPSGPVDIGDLAGRLTSDTLGDMLLGQDFGSMARGAAVDYIALVHAFLAAVQGRINDPLAKWRVGAEARRVAAAYAAWDAAMVGVAREVLKATPPEYTIAGARAVGCHLLRVIDPSSGKPLTLDKLKGELSIFYIAGFETTSHAITWTLGLLAAHPQQQDALAAELARVGLAPSDVHPEPRPFEWGDLSRLPLLNATIKESLRLFPPVSAAVVAGPNVCRLTCHQSYLLP